MDNFCNFLVCLLIMLTQPLYAASIETNTFDDNQTNQQTVGDVEFELEEEGLTIFDEFGEEEEEGGEVIDPNIPIRGNVNASAEIVAMGDPLTCTDELINIEGFDVETIPIRQVLIDRDSGEVINLEQSSVFIDARNGFRTTRNIDTSVLLSGNYYRCIVQIFANGVLIDLAGDEFLVRGSTSNISIDLVAQAGEKGRVLVLLDEAQYSEQKAFLESLLTQTGWFHTIVTSPADFESELRTGAYINYLILSQNQQLSKQQQNRLVKAVSDGAGLIVSGNLDQRRGRINKALGVRFRDKSQSTQGLALFDSVISNNDNVTLLTPKSVPIVKLNGATTVAQFLPSQTTGKYSESPAITVNEFNQGRSVYVGFDLLSEATLLNSDQSIFAEILVDSLDYTNNPSLLEKVGVSRIAQFTVTNSQQATPAQLTVALPQGVELINAPGASSVEPNQVVWLLDLGEQEQITVEILFTQSVSEATFDAVVQSGNPPDLLEQASASITFTTQPDVDVINDLGLANSFNAFIYKDFTSSASSSQGRIAAGGNVSLDSYGLATHLPSQPETSTLVVGGDLSFGQGRIFVGSGLAGGSTEGVNQGVISGLENGALIEGNATLPIDFKAEFRSLRRLSKRLSKVPANGSVEYRYGGIYISGDCSNNVQIFDLDGAMTLSSNHLVLNCVPDDATIIFNINGQTAGFSNIGLGQLSNRASRVLYNFYEAQTVQFRNVGIQGSVLATKAHLNNPTGQLNGSIIAKSWDGSMALNNVPFTGTLETALESKQ